MHVCLLQDKLRSIFKEDCSKVIGIESHVMAVPQKRCLNTCNRIDRYIHANSPAQTGDHCKQGMSFELCLTTDTPVFIFHILGGFESPFLDVQAIDCCTKAMWGTNQSVEMVCNDFLNIQNGLCLNCNT